MALYGMDNYIKSLIIMYSKNNLKGKYVHGYSWPKIVRTTRGSRVPESGVPRDHCTWLPKLRRWNCAIHWNQ